MFVCIGHSDVPLKFATREVQELNTKIITGPQFLSLSSLSSVIGFSSGRTQLWASKRQSELIVRNLGHNETLRRRPWMFVCMYGNHLRASPEVCFVCMGGQISG